MEIKIYNPNKLPLIDYRKPIAIQKDLKDLTESNYTKLKNVLIKRGFKVPLFLWADGDRMCLLDGTQRQRVMIKEDMRPYEVPYILIDAETEAEAKAQLLEIASQYGTITQEGFDSFMVSLPELDIQNINFDALQFVGQEPAVEEDEVPEVSSEPAVSVLGEVYQLGRHKVMCGDSTNYDSDKLFDKATISFTSPPYNVGHNIGYKTNSKYANDDDNKENYHDFLQLFTTKTLEKSDYSFINLQLLANNKVAIIEWLADNSENFVDIAYWKKSQVAPAIAANVMNSQVEVIIILSNKSNSRAINTGNFRGNVSNFIETSSASAENENSKEHNATMPVALAAHFISNFTNKGDSVYDPFTGTGTTLIACEQLDRTCYMMELDPKYTDVIRRRYWKFVNGGDETGWQENTPVIGVK